MSNRAERRRRSTLTKRAMAKMSPIEIVREVLRQNAEAERGLTPEQLARRRKRQLARHAAALKRYCDPRVVDAIIDWGKKMGGGTK